MTDDKARSPLRFAGLETDKLKPDSAPVSETATGNETRPPRTRRSKLSLRYWPHDLATDL